MFTVNFYIHIPFCVQKCYYCNFYSEPLSFVKKEVIPYYVDALCKEIKFKKDNVKNLKTIYIGGGTPSILSSKDISKILENVDKTYGIDKNAEISIEINPGTINIDKLRDYRYLGINRISIGIQSFEDEELSILGRIHSGLDGIKAIDLSRRAGFDNLSIDLIYGIPYKIGLDKRDYIKRWKLALKKATHLHPNHISTYELTLEDSTKIKKDVLSGIFNVPDEETIEEIYFHTIDLLESKGYHHYEISNFAVKGYECIHNINYWNRGQYLGVGAGAHSFYDNKRISNIKNVIKYIEFLKKCKFPILEEIKLTKEDELKEIVLLGLRKTEGIQMSMLSKTEIDLLKKAFAESIPQELVVIDDNHLRLTKKGFILSNEIIVKILLYIEQNLL